jgi:hypothetical protein
MNYRSNLGMAAVVIMLFPRIVAAQGPLRVEVLSDKNWNWEPTTVKITNVSNESIELVIPLNESIESRERTVNPLPMDVERHDGKEWLISPPDVEMSRGRSSAPTLNPGQSVRFEFAVAGGAGEYRTRVWFFASRGDPGPPWHPPKFGSAVSNTFEVISQLPVLILAQRSLRLCGTSAPSR